MISIAVLTDSTRPCLAVSHSLGIAEALARRGADVTVHCLARAGVRSFYRLIDPAVRVVFHEIPHVEDETAAQSTQRSISILAKAVQAGNYDVVHAQDGMTAKAAPGCIRTILRLDEETLREIAGGASNSNGEPATPHPAPDYPVTHYPATHYVVASEVLVEQAKLVLGSSPKVIPSGIFADRFVEASGRTVAAVGARNQWRTSLSSPFILTLGGAEPDNATIEVLEAVTLAREEIPSLELVIAGGNDAFKHRDYTISLDVRAAELGVRPVVLGPIEDEQLPSLVAACDVFVDFSKTEGFAAAGLEALAAGRSVVLRDMASYRRQFGHLARYGHDSASLSEVFNEALTEPADQKAEAQAHAEAYSWNQVADALLLYYEDIGLVSSKALA